jgi:K+-transporting ATPase ATPase C chain
MKDPKTGMEGLLSEFGRSAAATLFFILLCCGIYPVVVWAIAQGVFPGKTNGSLVKVNGKTAGSSLLSQGFTDKTYFHPRPSAAGQGYDAANSAGTNLGPTSKKLIEDVRNRVESYRAENGLAPDARVPADAVTSSASGLDPHISIENALIQAGRVAKARGKSKEEITAKVLAHTEGRDLGFLGEPRVNVLMLNLDLDGKL